MTSLWQETALPNFPALDRDLTVDVLIIGGGLTGLLCAHRLVKAGVNCALIEADRICQGVSGHTTAKITAQHGFCYRNLTQTFGEDKAKVYLRANLVAVERWRELCATFPCNFKEADSYVYTLTAPGSAQAEADALGKLGFPCEVTTPALPLAVQGAVKFAHQGQFHPLKFAAQLARALPIYEHTPALAYDGAHIVVPGHKILAQKIIVATHFPIFNKQGLYFLKLYQHRSYVLALEGADAPEGMYMDESGHGLSFRKYGRLLLLGGGSHRTGKRGGGWSELETFARRHYPNARAKYRWATQDCMSLDGVPYIGQYAPSTPNLFVATGYNKWGMTSSLVAAMVLGELVQGHKHPWAEVFDPSRSLLHPQLAVNAGESLWNLLTPTVPRCPHLGCALKWNRREHSWDCPCHGSRFGSDGTLLEGPATGDVTSLKGKRK